MSLVNYFRTIGKLGISSVLKVAYYRFSVRFKFNRALLINAHLIDEPIYNCPQMPNPDQPFVESWEKGTINNSFLSLKIQHQPPNWFYSQFTHKLSKDKGNVWSEIKDFDPELGDIKALWELSRFDWIIPLSQQASKGDTDALAILNIWLQDWQKENTPYLGVNWKCGQETSIRMIHLIMGAFILDQLETPTTTLINLVIAHLKRVEPTILYAIGQNNNHGTSEAAALYIGGGFLVKNGYKIGHKWHKKGERIIAERTSKLIGEDGTFSQYSLNYHRLMLDTLCCCEFFRTKLNFSPLPAVFYKKALLATNWLFLMIDSISGDGPNVGANDGARIIPLTNCGYRDFRPTVQLAMALFKSERAYPKGKWDDQFHWLKMEILDKKSDLPTSLIADDGGFAMLHRPNVFVCFRYPRYKFRPSQNDALHLDVWVKGKNILKDGGSFSYNADPVLMNYFGSVSAHNTIQFDNREPMKKISRFLYGNWRKTDWTSELKESDGCLSYGAGYTDAFGANHKRKVNLCQDKLVVTDEIINFKSNAILRWRLIDSDWELVENDNDVVLRSNSQNLTMRITCTEKITSSKLTEGLESLYYMKSNKIPVLELTLEKKCILTTSVTW
uniref:heparinase II/III domain-containing protein n=1 Tax=Algoriphagus sp. TaxID=1872435 RepID=UPI00404842CE